MKRSLLVFFSIVILMTSGCSAKRMDEKDKLQTMDDFAKCKGIVDQWLADYGESGYRHIATVKGLADMGYSEGEIHAIINEKEGLYGRIIGRTFLGYGRYAGGKQIFQASDVEASDLVRLGMSRAPDGFYEIDDGYFGLLRNADFRKRYPPGKYMILLYETTTEKREKVHEGIVLWAGKDRDWQLVFYNIGDDI